jgi:hypothetical protein
VTSRPNSSTFPSLDRSMPVDQVEQVALPALFGR